MFARFCGPRLCLISALCLKKIAMAKFLVSIAVIARADCVITDACPAIGSPPNHVLPALKRLGPKLSCLPKERVRGRKPRLGTNSNPKIIMKNKKFVGFIVAASLAVGTTATFAQNQ
jgi:hypothetical protein